jgi:peptide-methionine (S)-S-oxide reductase
MFREQTMTRTHLQAKRARGVLLTGLVATMALGFVMTSASAAEEARIIPAPAVDEPAGSTATSETAVLAGGCFWGVQGVFQHVDGVTSAVSGYAGGAKDTAHYEQVGRGDTGHAESVRVTFDPRKITYAKILQVYFSVAHDPTQLNRQGPDVGTQYRSAIFPTNAAQEKVAAAYVAQLDGAHAYASSIATKIEPGRAFYPAEGYHQDFLTLHPSYPYIVFNDLPKVAALKKVFPDVYRDKPVLVGTAKLTD